jgi:biopolymer transport protein ExbB
MFKMIDTVSRRMARATLMLAMALLVGLFMTPGPQAHAADVEAVALPGQDVTIAPVPAPEVANPYGLGALWAQGDAVAKITLLILVLMSVGSWYVIFTKFAEQSRMRQHGKAAQGDFWAAASLRQAVDGLDPASPYRFITEKGLESAHRHEGLLSNVDFNTWVSMSLQRALGTVQSRLQDSLAVLATDILTQLPGTDPRAATLTALALELRTRTERFFTQVVQALGAPPGSAAVAMRTASSGFE